MFKRSARERAPGAVSILAWVFSSRLHLTHAKGDTPLPCPRGPCPQGSAILLLTPRLPVCAAWAAPRHRREALRVPAALPLHGRAGARDRCLPSDCHWGGARHPPPWPPAALVLLGGAVWEPESSVRQEQRVTAHPVA